MELLSKSIKEKELLRVLESTIEDHSDELLVQTYVKIEGINIGSLIKGEYNSEEEQKKEVDKVFDLIWKKHRLLPMLKDNIINGWFHSIG